MLEGETIACTGARLTGRHLSGRDEGGGVWTIDLGQVTGAVYSENNQLAHVRHALELTTPENVRVVAVEVPHGRMAQSVDLLEHRALVARVAETLADLHPGFRMTYRVAHAPGRLWVVAGGVAVAALFLLVLLRPDESGASLGGAVLPFALAVAVLAAIVFVVRQRRQSADVSAAALPGILTAMGRRE